MTGKDHNGGDVRVTPVVVNGYPKFKIETRGNGGQTWYFVAQVRTCEEVGQYVDLSTLQ